MSIAPAWPQCLAFFGTPLVIEPSPGQLTGDAGLLPIRQFDNGIGLTRAFADALDDPRDPDLTEHTFLEMVRSRVYGILAGYEDQNDHDTLRADPVFKLVADRSPNDSDLASQPTLSRFENAISIKSLKQLRDVFLDQFIASFDTPPRHLTFDLDAVDDAAHGHQQLTFWHGYYDQNQYLPLVITCADNDQFVLLSLRPGNVHAALGADDDLAYLVTRLRAVWPDVVLHFRGDCGFGLPAMYDVCERLRVGYTFGIAYQSTKPPACSYLFWLWDEGPDLVTNPRSDPGSNQGGSAGPDPMPVATPVCVPDVLRQGKIAGRFEPLLEGQIRDRLAMLFLDSWGA